VIVCPAAVSEKLIESPEYALKSGTGFTVAAVEVEVVEQDVDPVAVDELEEDVDWVVLVLLLVVFVDEEVVLVELGAVVVEAVFEVEVAVVDVDVGAVVLVLVGAVVVLVDELVVGVKTLVVEVDELEVEEVNVVVDNGVAVVAALDELEDLLEDERTAYAPTAATPTMIIKTTAMTRGATALLLGNTGKLRGVFYLSNSENLRGLLRLWGSETRLLLSAFGRLEKPVGSNHVRLHAPLTAFGICLRIVHSTGRRRASKSLHLSKSLLRSSTAFC